MVYCYATFEEYQKAANRTAKPCPLIYTSNALAGEVGEVCNEVKKWARDDKQVMTYERQEKIAHELGDCLWYLTQLAQDIGYDLHDIAAMNIAKLQARHPERSSVESNTSTQRTA